MNILFEDKFVSQLIGCKSYICNNNLNFKLFKYLRKPFFITSKSKTKKNLKV